MIHYGLKDKVAMITGANNPQGIGAATLGEGLGFGEQGRGERGEVCGGAGTRRTAGSQVMLRPCLGVEKGLGAGSSGT